MAPTRLAAASGAPLLEDGERSAAPAGPASEVPGETGRVTTRYHIGDVFFRCANRLLVKGVEEGRTLTEADAEDLLPAEWPANSRDALQAAMESRHRAGKPSSLKMSILQAWWPLTLLSASLHGIEVALNFVSPPLIRSIVNYIDTKDTNILKGLLLASGYFLAPLFQSLFMCHFIINCRRVGMRTWGATSCLVFEKTLRLSQPAASSYGPGSLTNIMQVDTTRFDFAFFHLNFIWSMPFMLIVGVALLYRELGLAAFTPLVIMAAMYPLNNTLVNRLMNLSRDTSRSRDARIKILTEVMHAVRLIKMLAWEDQVAELVGESRKKEVGNIARFKIFEVVNGLVWQGVPLLLPLATFSTFILLGGKLDPGLVFSSLALLDMIRIPMNLFPQALQVIVQVRVGLHRIERLLGAEEMRKSTSTEHGTSTSQGGVGVAEHCRETVGVEGGKSGHVGFSAQLSGAAFRWADPSSIEEPAAPDKKCCEWLRRGLWQRETRTALTHPQSSLISLGEVGRELPVTLRVPSLEIPQGKLIFICGAVGSGKSALVAALLNEVPLLEGRVHVRGPVAYCAQKPWILHGNVRDNILFGEEDDPARFEEVVRACALETDLKELKDGADTVIGERGINLSGGQKARIGLARAVYKHNSAHMYILDDPLSAVDMHVAQHLMEECLGSEHGLLRHTTRVLITHQLQYIDRADLLIVVRGGEIAACKPPAQYSEDELKAFGLDVKHGPEGGGGSESSASSERAPMVAPTLAGKDTTAFQPLSLVRSISAGSDVLAMAPSSSIPWGDCMQREGGSPCERLDLGGPRWKALDRRRSSQLPHELVRSFSQPDDEPLPGAPQRHKLVRSRTDPCSPLPPRTIENGGSPVSLAEESADVVDIDDATAEQQEQQQQQQPAADLTAPAVPAALATANGEEEERQIGALDLEVWLTYARAMGGCVAAVLCCCYWLINGLNLASTFYLARWSAQKDTTESEELSSLLVYACLSLVATLILTFRMLLFRRTSLKVSRQLHTDVLWAVLRSPMAWLDRTPTGRIVNRLSQDLQKVDMESQGTLSNFANSTVDLIVSSVVVVLYAPIVLVVFVPLLYFYKKVQHLFRTTARELQRLGSRAKSPIFQGLDEAITGVSSIRAYEKQDYFIKRNADCTLLHISLQFNLMCCNRWLCVRLRMLGTVPVATVTLCMVLQAHLKFGGVAISGAAAGLVLRYALQFAQSCEGFLQSLTNTELVLVAIERITSYAGLEGEPPLSADADATLQQWPTAGEIEFDRVIMRYRAELPTVLNGISFTIRGGTSLGVVGRTGAGKSSLLQALFRMCSLDSGRILIDRVDISTLGLHTLRKRLSIIPQDPVGFTGTLRFNLDPFKEKQESELWEKLEEVQLAEFVRSKEQGLDFDLTAGGENLSVGQMQLVCAARALLRNSPILILDEATASVDYKTDELIQHVLRQEVTTKKMTTLTVAHRINTIMGNDNVLVVDKGMAAEFGPPKVLAKDPTSRFYSFANAADKE